METRSKASYRSTLFDFIAFDILISCPSCSAKAIVKTEIAEKKNIKVACTHCGYHKYWEGQTIAHVTPKGKSSKTYTLQLGSAVDPYFRLPLWLSTDCEGYTLWAYNKEHLNMIHEHVEAKLRERNDLANSNQSIGSRLPRWMTSKRNRETILKKIFELQKK